MSRGEAHIPRSNGSLGKTYYDKYPTDIHDWIDYHHPHDSRIYPYMKAEVTQFYERLRKINRNDFIEHLSTRIAKLKTQKEVVGELYTRYEAAYLTLQQEFHVAQSSAAVRDLGTDRSGFRRESDLIVSRAQQMEQERQALDLVRSWHSYLNEWVVVMDELLDHWEDIWDWYECGLYAGDWRPWNGSLPDIDRHVELLKELRGLEVRADFAMRGASEKGDRVLSLGACVK